MDLSALEAKDWLPAVFGLLGAVVGGAVSLIATSLQLGNARKLSLQDRAEQRRRDSFESAKALRDMFDVRSKLPDGPQSYIEAWKFTKIVDMSVHAKSITSKEYRDEVMSVVSLASNYATALETGAKWDGLLPGFLVVRGRLLLTEYITGTEPEKAQRFTWLPWIKAKVDPLQLVRDALNDHFKNDSF